MIPTQVHIVYQDRVKIRSESILCTGWGKLVLWCRLYCYRYVAVWVMVLSSSVVCRKPEDWICIFNFYIAKLFLLWEDNFISMKNELIFVCQVYNLQVIWCIHTKNYSCSHLIDVGTLIQTIEAIFFLTSYGIKWSEEDLNPGLSIPKEPFPCITNNRKCSHLNYFYIKHSSSTKNTSAFMIIGLDNSWCVRAHGNLLKTYILMMFFCVSVTLCSYLFGLGTEIMRSF